MSAVPKVKYFPGRDGAPSAAPPSPQLRVAELMFELVACENRLARLNTELAQAQAELADQADKF